MQTLTLPYPPSANRLWRSYQLRVVKNTKAATYQRCVQLIALSAGIRPLIGPVRLDITLHPKKPKRKTSKPVRSIDLSNSLKCVEDALNGIAWADDRQVEEITARRSHPVTDGALIVRWEIIED